MVAVSIQTLSIVWAGAFLGALAAAIHAPIGLRSVLREWAKWRGRSLDLAMLIFSALLLVLGTRAALAVYLA